MEVQKALARGIAAIVRARCSGGGGPCAGRRSGFDVVLGTVRARLATIEFVLDQDDKRKVHDIAIADMVANCEDNRAELDFDIYGNTKVLDDRSFAVRSEDVQNPKAKAVVRGQFSRKFKRVRGTARLYGKFKLGGDEGLTQCETDKQKFKATVTG